MIFRSTRLGLFSIGSIDQLRGLETRHPVEGPFGSKFSAICNHCRAMTAKSRKTWNFCEQFLRFFGKNDPCCYCADHAQYLPGPAPTPHDFAYIIQFQHKGYLNSWLYFISFSFTTRHFWMCVIWKKTYYFHFNSWLSFQRLCRLLLGYQFTFVISNPGSNTSDSF